tara:strand:+ start:636 stop:797 length:162 start_codon:yes stop_codon:yes gene_type:complete
MIRIVIVLLIAYLCLHLLMLFKNKNVRKKNRSKKKFSPPSKDNVRDAEFEDSK